MDVSRQADAAPVSQVLMVARLPIGDAAAGIVLLDDDFLAHPWGFLAIFH